MALPQWFPKPHEQSWLTLGLYQVMMFVALFLCVFTMSSAALVFYMLAWIFGSLSLVAALIRPRRWTSSLVFVSSTVTIFVLVSNALNKALHAFFWCRMHEGCAESIILFFLFMFLDVVFACVFTVRLVTIVVDGPGTTGSTATMKIS